MLKQYVEKVLANCTFNNEKGQVVTFTNIHQSIDVKIDNPEQKNIDFILPGQQYGIHF